jgi:hypothetical protein
MLQLVVNWEPQQSLLTLLLNLKPLHGLLSCALQCCSAAVKRLACQVRQILQTGVVLRVSSQAAHLWSGLLLQLLAAALMLSWLGTLGLLHMTVALHAAVTARPC